MILVHIHDTCTYTWYLYVYMILVRIHDTCTYTWYLYVYMILVRIHDTCTYTWYLYVYMIMWSIIKKCKSKWGNIGTPVLKPSHVCCKKSKFDVWIQKGSICFFIHKYLEPFSFHPLQWSRYTIKAKAGHRIQLTNMINIINPIVCNNVSSSFVVVLLFFI